MKLALVLPALLLALAALALAAGIAIRRRAGARQRAVSRLLDAADALEQRLRSARAELEAVAGDPTRDALQEMLRQRLWLQQHGPGASLDQLDRVRRSLEQAGTRLEGQLQRVRHARAASA